MIPIIIGVVAIVIVAGSLYGLSTSQNTKKPSGLPILWWFVDDGEPNTKSWASFEDRATYEPVEPYLSLCLDKARDLWSPSWEIRPIIGRRAALAIIKDPPAGVIRTPPSLWIAWLRATLLAQQGGLWIDGSVLPLASGETLRARVNGHDVLTFGTDPDESLATASQESKAGAPAAGLSAGWSAKPGNPMWSGLSASIAAVIASGPPSWSAFDARRALRTLWDKHCGGVTLVDRKAEVSRSPYGRLLDYVDLFATSEVTVDTSNALWLPLPEGRNALDRKTAYQWFTRLSKQQIVESDFFWARMARGP